MGVAYRIVVEEQEYDQYAAVIDPARLLILDPAYQRAYDPCDDLGTSKSLGPGPARNFAWDHAISGGHDWHWVMDDNIYGFRRYHRNEKLLMRDGTGFRVMEDFCDRYSNVAMAGPNYDKFVVQSDRRRPLTLNTRIYSCNLIRNDVPFRWRGRYNEDTDLSLRMLKAGWCTVQFNALLQSKATTQMVKGGNTAEFYSREGTLPKSEMLVRLHPDVARLAFRFHRWHHYVDYTPFRHNLLRLRPGVEPPSGTDEYGLVLRDSRS